MTGKPHEETSHNMICRDMHLSPKRTQLADHITVTTDVRQYVNTYIDGRPQYTLKRHLVMFC